MKNVIVLLERGGGFLIALFPRLLSILGKGQRTVLYLKTVLLMFILISDYNRGLTQNTPFIEMLDATTLVLTQEEEERFALIDSSGTNITKWHVSLHPIQNYLNGNLLTINNPQEEDSITFIADYVTSDTGGNYYWSGYNSDGSTFRLGKYPQGFQGTLYIASSNSFYGIISLSATKTALIKYTNWELDFEGECDQAASEDEEGEGEIEDRSGCEGNNIRVLVLFTPASTTTAFNPLVVAPGLIAELNASTAASGLSPSDITFTLANTLLLPGFIEDPNDIDGDVNALTNSAAAQSLRDNNYADIVILLTDNVYTGAFGVARGISTINANAYCLAQIRNAALTFTGSHEIGHVIGARHQRCTTCQANWSCDPSPWNNHGFTVGAPWGTIMLTLPCGRTRIGRWSSATALFAGLETGNSFNDNARKLRRRADNVSCFRNVPPAPDELTNVDINGPSEICSGSGFGFYTATFNIVNGVAPFAYQWQVSPNGVSGWQTIGTSEFLPLTNAGALTNPFYLRVIITDFAGKSGMDIMEVRIVNCLGGIGEERAAAVSEQFVVYPNPVTDLLNIRIKEQVNSMLVLNAEGVVVYTTNVKNGAQAITLPVSDWNPGTYFIRIMTDNGTQTFKILKL